MKRLIKKWHKNRMSFWLSLIGYIIGILAVSLGISITDNARQYSLECTQGYPNDNCNIEYKSKKECMTEDKILPILQKAAYKSQIQILDFGDEVKTASETFDKVEIIPTIYNVEPGWKMNMLKGRSFKPSETQSNDKIIIVGKGIGKKLIKNWNVDNYVYI